MAKRLLAIWLLILSFSFYATQNNSIFLCNGSTTILLSDQPYYSTYNLYIPNQTLGLTNPNELRLTLRKILYPYGIRESNNGLLVIPSGIYPEINNSSLYIGKDLVLINGSVVNKKPNVKWHIDSLPDSFGYSNIAYLLLYQNFSTKEYYYFNCSSPKYVSLPYYPYARIISNGKIKDVHLLPGREISVEKNGNNYIFLFLSNQSTSKFIVYKDGTIIYRSFLNSNSNVFRTNVSLSSPGTYLIYFSNPDSYYFFIIHNISINLTRSRDIFYYFNVYVDGQPYNGPILFLNRNQTINVYNGTFSIQSKDRLFSFALFDQTFSIEAKRSSNIYYLLIVLFSLIFIFMVLFFKPSLSYKLKSSEYLNKKKIKLSLSSLLKDISFLIKKRKGLPIYVDELASYLSTKYGYPIDPFALYFSLKELHYKKKLFMKDDLINIKNKDFLFRKIYDLLITKGISFKFNKFFETKDYIIATEYVPTNKRLIIVFYDENDKQSYLNNLPSKKRASLTLLLYSRNLFLLTLEGLKYFL